MKKLIFISLISFLSLSAFAQTAIRGKLIDNETGEPMLFANVGIKGTTIGGISDFDGNFSIESPSLTTGSYDIQVSFVSYETKIIEGVKVTEGEVTWLGEVRMNPAGEQLKEVVVAAEAVKSSETAMLTMKKKSAVMLDGISSEEMKLIGDGSAGEAAKRVTGVTVEGGKYVYVRGLGDRYTKTTMNGVDIPGLDPDRNTLQMDLFPTNLIDNIMISKNFTAELPADFTGGLVNVDIKDLPEKKIFKVAAKVGYNPDMHLRNDYLNYEGGGTDFLGFDDGTRALPKGAESAEIPTPISGASESEVNDFVNNFNKTLGADQANSFLDLDFGISYGDQIRLGQNKEERSEKDPRLGYIFSVSYKSDFRFYDDVVYGEYQRAQDSKENELVVANLQSGELGEREFLVGLMGGLAYKTNMSKIRFTVMRLQNGESRAGQFRIDNDPDSVGAVGQSGYTAYSDNLEYEQRSLTNALINGKHTLGETGWEIDWKVSPTYSTSADPDIRKTAFTYTPIDTFFSAGAGGLPSRIWRSLYEINAQSMVDVTKKYQLQGKKAKLKFGASYVYKFRDYEILQYDAQFFWRQNWPNPDPNVVLDPKNIYPNNPNGLYYQSGNNSPNPNAYQSNINLIALYVSNEWKIADRLNTILGVRMENFTQRHTGRDIAWANGDTQNGNNLDNDIVLQSTDLFPTANFIYQLSENMNLRFAFSQTIARPSFKELSFAQIIDPMTNRIFNGSLFQYPDWDGNLTETRINNLDLRWEYFAKDDQMVSVSTFYKAFDRPIELVRIPEQQTSTEYQARNVGDGTVLGLEFELRKNLNFITEKLRNLKFSGNVTLVRSQIDMSEKEYNSRKQYERDGETIENTRQMAGQAPFVINAGLIYHETATGIDAGIFYNVKGPTLYLVGVGLYPDVYTEPFHSLNLSLNKRFGEDRRTVVEFKIVNLLDDRFEQFFQSYEATPQLFTGYSPGRTFSIGVSHSF